MSRTHLGKRQRQILIAMRAGAELWNEGGMWELVRDGRRLSIGILATSALALQARGYIMHNSTETHSAYRGGFLSKFALTRKGEGG